MTSIARTRATVHTGAGDLGYEVALLSLAEAAAANLAAGRADPRDPAALAASIAETRGVAHAAVALALLTRVALSPQLLQLPADRAVELELGTLASLGGLSGASLWMLQLGTVTRRCAVGEAATVASERAAVEQLLEGEPADDRLVAGTIVQAGAPAAVVLARAASESSAPVEPFLAVACSALGLVLEREVLLRRGSESEAALAAAHDRRLARLGFDLHDGPLQDIAVMAADLRVARSRAEEELPPPAREPLVGCLDGLLERLRELDIDLRDVAHSLETAAAVHQPLADVLRSEVRALGRRTEIATELNVSGELDDLSDSQKIALSRIVHEALANVREHSSASSVSVSLSGSASSTQLEIADDGRGFDVETELIASARRGRLGLVGASERIRLLGGTFTVCSSPGCGTQLLVLLPRWVS